MRIDTLKIDLRDTHREATVFAVYHEVAGKLGHVVETNAIDAVYRFARAQGATEQNARRISISSKWYAMEV